MKDIKLADWMAVRKQKEAAKLIGCNQSAVSQMIRSGRQIYVRVTDLGEVVKVWEERPVGAKGKKESA